MGVAKAALFLFGHVLTFQIRKRSRGPLARTHKEVTKFTKEETGRELISNYFPLQSEREKNTRRCPRKRRQTYVNKRTVADGPP